MAIKKKELNNNVLLSSFLCKILRGLFCKILEIIKKFMLLLKYHKKVIYFYSSIKYLITKPA